ncbi:arginine/serine-rich coiled-coil protein 2 isoform X2 [Sitodiplosis mosellana]|uniref:arginine/serine-rich coiled-coil protein 2 isoform X2 n=1 Tax=Sitodiplosis mosellana TaxID=263140 RepID=UPI00244526B2|nr:arginine/serine-rich coiled-coil protein 2 isoform X2 [Sitodiplosis mosellana]
MESIVNYESDDGNLKITNKSSTKNSAHIEEKRRCLSDDDSSDDSSSPREQNRKDLKEDVNRSASRYSPSPRKSSHKSSRRDKHKSHERGSDRRRRSSSKDSDRHERKMKDRDDKKKYREKRRDRSDSRDRGEQSGRSSERRKERHDDHRRSNKYEREGERRFDDKRDYNQRREEPTHRNNSRSLNDARSNSTLSNSSSAKRRAEALNRTIERRANEKVQQLQKLGIEIPGIMKPIEIPGIMHQQQQQLHFKSQSQPSSMQLKPLISSGTSQINSTTSTPVDETAAENDTNLTLNLSNFTSSVLTNARYTEQMQKKKLIWGAKKTTTETATTNNKWEAAKFSQDSDGKVASKFLRLMGMKNAPVTATTDHDGVEKREQMFSSMEQQYEIARQATHTMRGMGLGFGSQSRPC